MNQKEAIKAAPNGMKEVLEILTEEHTFKKFDADAKWNKSKSKMLVVGVDLSDVTSISKISGVPTTTMSNRKVVNLEVNKWKIRFRESHKKGSSKAPDAKTTAMQEAGSKYVFEYALNNKKGGWATEQKFNNDQKMIEGLRKIYPDVDEDWLDVFFKQHKVILEKFGDTKINRFDHTGGFMSEITQIVNTNFNIKKKDNWNPADIWGVKGDSNKVIAKVKETVFGSKDSQTIQQLNALLRGMYKSKELVGVSLKKTSGKQAKWEEYNIDALTLSEINDYKYNQIDIIINFKATGQTQALDTAVQLRQSGGGSEYNFQITSNDTSKGSQNLKFESKPIGSAKARGGKAQITAVEALLDDNAVGGYKNKHQNYPKNLDEFQHKNIAGRDLKSYKMMFTDIRTKVTTDCKDDDDFVATIEKIFLGSKPWVAQSKLMQLTFLHHALKVKPKKKYTEFWTDMLFLSIKKGDRFGPFGKLY